MSEEKDAQFLEQARVYAGRLWREQKHNELVEASRAASQAMLQIGLALKPVIERLNAVALSPAFREIALEASVHYTYADDLCEPEEDVFV